MPDGDGDTDPGRPIQSNFRQTYGLEQCWGTGFAADFL